MSTCRAALSTKIWNWLILPGIFIVVLATTSATVAQQRESASGVIPRVAFRERTKSIDEYDRQFDRLKIAEMISSARKRNLLIQINEDFHRIKVLHNEVILTIRAEDKLKYDRLIEFVTEMKKRGKRLKTNLALPVPENSKDNVKVVASAKDIDVKESVIKLHASVVSFVTNPMFTEPGVLEVGAINRASGDLKEIILLSDRIKSLAEKLRGLTAGKRE